MLGTRDAEACKPNPHVSMPRHCAARRKAIYFTALRAGLSHLRCAALDSSRDDLPAKSEPVESLDGKHEGWCSRGHETPELPHGSCGGQVLPA